MRRIITFDNVSADGCFADASGGLGWVVQDAEIHRGAVGSMRDIDAIMFGRRTYDMFESFWPMFMTTPGNMSGPHGEAADPAMQAMGRFINQSTKIVFSRTRGTLTWMNSLLIGEFDPHQIREMKKGPGKDIIVFGSGTIVSQLSAHALVDEYQFVVNPLVLGSGKPMIQGVPAPLRLRLLEAKPFKTGNVMLRYAPAS